MVERKSDKTKVIVQFSTSPLGESVGISKYVAKALKVVKDSGIKYQLTPMSTILETDTLEKALNVIIKAHQSIADAGASRVITDIKIDDRRDKPRSMEDKVNKVQNQLGK